MSSTEAGDPLAAGEHALAQGDWRAARDAFARAAGPAGSGSAEALAGLGDALWWLGEVRESIACKERAYTAFQHRGDMAAAAMVAGQLSMDYWDNLGNTAAGLGWLERARRLVDEHALTPVRGWVTLLEAHHSNNPQRSEPLAGQALTLAREVGDIDLELCALSQRGAALVELGRVVEGVRLLDEAMAGALAGESNRPDTVVFAACTTLQACTAGAEFERAVQWLRATDRFSARFGGPYLRANCRLRYGTLLVAIGDWIQAEQELTAAVTIAAGALPGLHEQALAGLAWLRLAQGRLDEAAQLIAGLGERPGAAVVAGALHLRHGRPESARSVLQRGLAGFGAHRLQAVALRELLGEALLACGDVAAAEAHADLLMTFGDAETCRIASAFGQRLRGRALAAAGETAQAHDHLDTALAAFVALGMPYEEARTRLLLAYLLRERSSPAATDEARTALVAFEALGAGSDADAAAALLREQGASAGRGGTRTGIAALTRREREVLVLLGQGLSNPQIAERLYLSRKTVEHHVARVLSKLGLPSRAAAAAEAVRGGLLSGSDQRGE